MPKQELCPGSGDVVLGPDENDGTVQCLKCGRNFLRMKKTIKNGVEQLSVSDHYRTAQALKRKTGTGRGRGTSQRSSPRK